MDEGTPICKFPCRFFLRGDKNKNFVECQVLPAYALSKIQLYKKHYVYAYTNSIGNAKSQSFILLAAGKTNLIKVENLKSI